MATQIKEKLKQLVAEFKNYSGTAGEAAENMKKAAEAAKKVSEEIRKQKG